MQSCKNPRVRPTERAAYSWETVIFVSVKKTLETLQRYFGYHSFRPGQERVIDSALAGRDSLVLMPTGGGKSLCYQLPALMLQGTAVVISPLISLMDDQVQALRQSGISAAALHSAQSADENARLRLLSRRGELKLLYLSPETALHEAPDLLSDINVSLLAVDEAHCVSQWGHDFRPEYARLASLRDSEALAKVPMMALTATADKVTRRDIVRQLGLREPAVFVSSFDRPNLSLRVERGMKKAEKDRALLRFVNAHEGSGIIYCLSRKGSEQVAAMLVRHGLRAVTYHAGLSAEERAQAQSDFIFDRVQIVCATIAFGMGIDKSNVRWVVHYNLPGSIENFYQEIGRAGRDGLPADTLLFYSVADVIQREHFARESGLKEINRERLRRMREYAEADVCRRRILLNYFGEAMDHDCGNCDVCRNPPRRFDGTILAQKALSAIVRAEGRAGFGAVVDILMGRFSPAVKAHGFFNLKTFGAGTDATMNEWQDYLMQFLQLGLIEIAYDDHNHLRVTDQGRAVLFEGRPVQLAVMKPAEAPQPHAGSTRAEPKLPLRGMPAATREEDEQLFQQLRALRRELAAAQGVPPFIVMGDQVLRALVAAKPTTVEKFGRVQGIGEFKQRKYGPPFVAAIRRFLNQN